MGKYYKEREREYLLNSFSLFISLAATIVLAIFFYHNTPWFVELPARSEYAGLSPVWGSTMNPQPRENFLYQFSLIFFPVSFFVLRFWINTKNIKFRKTEMYAQMFSLFGAGVFIYILTINYENVKFYMKHSIIYTDIVLYVILFIFSLILMAVMFKSKIADSVVKWLYFIIDVFVFVFIYYTVIFLFRYVGNLEHHAQHFEVIFNSVVQVCAGKTLLVDFSNQYGLYPHFLEPLINMMGGLTTYKFTVVLGVLMGISVASIYMFLRISIKNKIILLFGFFAIVYYSYFVNKIYKTSDMYYQYHPLRILFPCLLLFFAGLYFKTKSKILYYLNLAIFSVGVLWNFDAGAVTYAALVLALIFGEIVDCEDAGSVKLNIKRISWKIWFHLSNAAAVFTCVVIAYQIVMYFRSGQFPDILSLVAYSTLFYHLGFDMMKMPLVQVWNLAALLVAVALGVSLGYVFSKNKNSEENFFYKSLFLVAVLSAGVFSYYQRRSHPAVFSVVMYMPMILLVVFVDKMYSEIKEDIINKKVIVGRLVCFIIIIFALFGPIFDVNKVINHIKSTAKFQKRANENWYSREIEYFKQKFETGQEILIVARETSVFYAETKTTTPLKLPSFIEMMTIEQINVVREYLMETMPGRQVVIEPAFFGNLKFDLNKNYRVKSTSPSGRHVIYEQSENIFRPKYALILKPFDSIFHCQYSEEGAYVVVDNSGKITDNVNYQAGQNIGTGKNFTIQMIIYNVGKQNDFCTLVGDAYRDKGFVVGLRAKNSNDYIFAINNNYKEYSTDVFRLKPDSINYLVIVFDNSKASVYINGKLELNHEFSEIYNPSDGMLTVGENYQGDILEAKISKGKIRKELIQKNYERIKTIEW